MDLLNAGRGREVASGRHPGHSARGRCDRRSRRWAPPQRGPTVLAAACLLGALAHASAQTTGAAAQARLADDVARRRPIVVHVVVALCDNQHQGIVPVPAHLGDGQDPGSNLYWGALYGVRSHLTRAARWKLVSSEVPADPKILERVVLKKVVPRNGQGAATYLVADAWDGAHIRPAVARFLSMASGRATQSVTVGSSSLDAGGGAHLVAYVGHNGLMDFSLPAPDAEPAAAPRGAAVLACASKPYFFDALQAAGAHPVLLTTGLMAPEAYSLDALVTSWVAGATGSAVREATAQAYHSYQKCGLGAARRLFWSGGER